MDEGRRRKETRTQIVRARFCRRLSWVAPASCTLRQPASQPASGRPRKDGCMGKEKDSARRAKYRLAAALERRERSPQGNARHLQKIKKKKKERIIAHHDGVGSVNTVIKQPPPAGKDKNRNKPSRGGRRKDKKGLADRPLLAADDTGESNPKADNPRHRLWMKMFGRDEPKGVDIWLMPVALSGFPIDTCDPLRNPQKLGSSYLTSQKVKTHDETTVRGAEVPGQLRLAGIEGASQEYHKEMVIVRVHQQSTGCRAPPEDSDRKQIQEKAAILQL
ncbi:hypothetical protein MGYG_05497 [Nannizzia gypsea CBS 118893]|uniref:Uncharacterized protein n=1 Tax=Arthroderma gypseum (strain ATCC MYA-4604 / CBS 118893) TaxID=535722 RepID=E4UWA7_ARTGP|nr:hypothetical protein MGYG_05497 [Nannizzia gypsea CBS 118893]EFR02502.1 hypothetical protein MGYG_05497 [Nannizzia gypsea CBS 118893]